MARLERIEGVRGVWLRRNADGSQAFVARVTYKNRQVTKAFDSLKKAEAAREKWLAEIKASKALNQEWQGVKRTRSEQKRLAPKTPPSLAAFIDDKFIKNHASTLRSKKHYEFRCEAIKAKIGHIRLDRLTVMEVTRAYNAWIEETSVSTANHNLKVLGIVLRRAVLWGEIADEKLTERVSRRRAAEPAERWVDSEEEAIILKHSPSWLADLIVVAVESGLRQAELLGLQWSEVRFPENAIRLDGGRTKNARGRTVPLTARARKTLDRLRFGADKTGPVFFKEGRPVSTTMLNREWRRVKKKAKVTTRLRWHDWRHSCATRMVRRGVDLYDVKEWLGHSSIRVTERYAHHSPDRLQRVAAAMDAQTCETACDTKTESA